MTTFYSTRYNNTGTRLEVDDAGRQWRLHYSSGAQMWHPIGDGDEGVKRFYREINAAGWQQEIPSWQKMPQGL